jgi:hypothetical protein
MSDTKSQLMPYFAKSEMIQKYFIETVIKFYVDIEFAG